MANEKELKQINKNGILVHQLLSENKNSALSYFSIDSIEKVSHDSDGLQIFFKEYDLVVKSILRRKIEVKGLFYKIYPKVTNLTVIGIGPYITNSEIESIMKYCGFIIDSYRIQETRQENGYKTVSLTNDYRIVLDVPEVFAPKLRPIKLPNIRDKTFEVLFFCRFCRNNGHMQFQCPKVVQRSPSPFKRYPKINVSKTPYEKDYSDLVINKGRISCHKSDFCVNKRNHKTYSNHHEKNEKESNYFPDQNSYSKNSSDSSSSTHHKSKDVFRRKSYEKNSGDSVIRKNESNSHQSDFCANKRKSKTRPNFHVKIEKEQNYFPDQSCSKNSCNSSSSSYHQNIDVFRRISCEKDSGDLVNRINETNSNQSDFCVKKRNSKTRPDFNLKIKKEQNYFPNQSCSKKSCNSSSTSYHQNMDVSGRIPWERDSGDLIISKNESNSHESDFCVEKQNSKIRPDSHKQNEKEQNNFSDQNCYTKKSFHSSSSTYHQSTDASRGISCENNYGDLSIENNEIDCPASDFCVDQKVSNKNSSDSHAKTKKEQNNCYRNKSNKNDSLKISYVKSTHSKPKNFYSGHQVADCVKMHRKHRKVKVSSMPTDANEIGKDNNSPAFKEQPTEIEKMDVDQHCEKEEEAFEKIPASVSNECSHKRTFSTNSKRKKEKKKFMKLLPKLLPPNVDLLETKKLIKIALKCDPKDIPEEVKDVLLTILKYNSGVKRKIGNKATRIFLHWVEAVLSKIMKAEKFQSENASEDPVKHHIKEKEHDKDGKSTTGIPNEQSQRKRKITLSLGIQEAISKTPGELKPTFLCNFLNQVRGRKKLFEVASAFTKNIPALAAQLLEVRNTYYRCVGKRGPEEDRDLSYIKRLRLRLLQHSGNATDVALEREVSMAEAPSEIESDITEVPVKTESNMTEVCVKTESDMTEVCMKTESDMTDMPVKTESDMRGQFAEAQWNMAEMFVKTESDIAEISVKTESDMTNTFVNAELDMTKTSVGESDMREMSVETESDMREISVKRETEIFTRQFSSCEEFQALSSYSLHGASYFTNITQMPFSLTSIKTEVNYID